MKTLSVILASIAVTLSGCAHTSYERSYGSYGYGNYGYGTSYGVERHYEYPSYNYYSPPIHNHYYVPQRPHVVPPHQHDRDRHDDWQHRNSHHQRPQAVERHDDDRRETKPWGRGEQRRHDETSREEFHQRVSPQRHDDQNRRVERNEASEGTRQGRWADGNGRPKKEGQFGRQRD